MTFSGDLDKLQGFIDSFTSYKESIQGYNSNSEGYLKGFISAITMSGVSYDDQMQNKLSKYKAKVQELEKNLDGTISELKDLLERAQKASQAVNKAGSSSMSSVNTTV